MYSTIKRFSDSADVSVLGRLSCTISTHRQHCKQCAYMRAVATDRVAWSVRWLQRWFLQTRPSWFAARTGVSRGFCSAIQIRLSVTSQFRLMLKSVLFCWPFRLWRRCHALWQISVNWRVWNVGLLLVFIVIIIITFLPSVAYDPDGWHYYYCYYYY